MTTTNQEEAQRKIYQLNNAELENWGKIRSGPVAPNTGVFYEDPYKSWSGPCGYAEEMENYFVENVPVNESIKKSHNEWVSNRRAWSGVSKYLQESIPIVTDWRGIRLPQPTPQSCNRAELTEYGPADYMYFVGSQTERLYDVVQTPKEMAGYYRESTAPGAGVVSYSLYGF